MALKRAMPPSHPGEILREDVLPALVPSVLDAATKLASRARRCIALPRGSIRAP